MMRGARVWALATLFACSAALNVTSSNTATQAPQAKLRAPVAADVKPAAAADNGGVSSWLQRVQRFGKGACLPLMAVLRRKSSIQPAPTGPAGSAPPPEANEDVSATQAALTWMSSQAVYLVFALIVAYFYKANKEWVLGQEAVKTSEKNYKEWTSPEIEPILCWSFLCPSVRWADSMAMAGIVSGFWKAMALYIVVSMVSGIAFGLPGWLLMTSFLLIFRCKIRTKFEMQQSYFQDFCCYCWCAPCLVAQEARHVEDAHAAGILL